MSSMSRSALRVTRVAALGLAILIVAALHGATAQTTRPNIVLIVADDMGYADVGFQGGKDIPTPNIDALAKGGVRFTNGYVTGPYCSPTRAGLMTGRYPQRFGHEFNIAGMDTHADAGLPVSEVTLANRLHDAGYRTAVIGKWHLGMAPQFRPRQRGFDEFFGFLTGGHTYVAQVERNPVIDNDSIASRVTYLTDDFTDRAVDFIGRNRARPFFLYLAYNAVHLPAQAPEKYLSRFPDLAEPRRTYAAMLSAMDDGVGRVVAALREHGLDGNTLIVFFSDNGGPTTVGGVNGSSNAPLRGSKRETWEGGIHVPFAMSWKGRIPAGGDYRMPIIQLDVHPTVLAAAGVAVRPEWKLDGVNLLPYLTGNNTAAPHSALYWRLGTNMAIRQGDWKLVKMSQRGFLTSPDSVDLSDAQLFDLKSDISETTNLASREPARVKTLRAAWEAWARQLAKPAWAPPAREP
jgi:arylsulfatase A-like enzyme